MSAWLASRSLTEASVISVLERQSEIGLRRPHVTHRGAVDPVTCPVFRRDSCQGSLAGRYGPGRAADSTAAANAAMDGNSQSGVTGAGG